MMIEDRRGHCVWPLIVAGLLLGSPGCGGPRSAEPEKTSLSALAKMYSQFQAHHRGQLPPNEQELKQFISDTGAALLDELGYSSADDLFVSDRDGQPYVVLYGNSVIMSDELPGGGLIAYEKDGVDGVRFVAYRVGLVEEMAADRFAQFVTP